MANSWRGPVRPWHGKDSGENEEWMEIGEVEGEMKRMEEVERDIEEREKDIERLEGEYARMFGEEAAAELDREGDDQPGHQSKECVPKGEWVEFGVD